MKKIKVGYWISNDGDGSASARFCGSKKAATIAEAQDFENFGEGFAEETADELNIYFDGEDFYIRNRVYSQGQFITVEEKLEVVNET